MWEYLLLRATGRYVHEVAERDWLNKPLEEALNELGREDWEMCGITGSSNLLTMIFKRLNRSYLEVERLASQKSASTKLNTQPLEAIPSISKLMKVS